jgi:hypothetical protein
MGYEFEALIIKIATQIHKKHKYHNYLMFAYSIKTKRK